MKTGIKTASSNAKYTAIYYYGVDFSRVRINDAPKISKNPEYYKVYPPSWISYVEKEMPPDGFVKNSTGFSNFNYCQKEIYEASIAVNPKFIIGTDYSIPEDTLNSMIKGYALQSPSGLGLVLIPELFSKPREIANTWVVLFDIGTRKILYKAKTSGKCQHMGYTAHWASGVVDGFMNFAK
jgi:hypothetical protein